MRSVFLYPHFLSRSLLLGAYSATLLTPLVSFANEFQNDSFPSDSLDPAPSLTPSEIKGLGIKSTHPDTRILPEPILNPGLHKKIAQRVCYHAGSQLNRELCEYLGERGNHLKALAATISDDNPRAASPSGLLFSKGWFGYTDNSCAAFMGTALRVGHVENVGNLQTTLQLTQKLQKKGWTKSPPTRDPSKRCYGIRPGDIVFTEDAASWPGVPAHVFMFFDWHGPTDSASHPDTVNTSEAATRHFESPPENGWDAYWEAGIDSTKSHPWALAIDNSRAPGKFKYLRPLREKMARPPGSDKETYGCWYYMRGPNPVVRDTHPD